LARFAVNITSAKRFAECRKASSTVILAILTSYLHQITNIFGY
jgi:hypothetical protein